MSKRIYSIINPTDLNDLTNQLNRVLDRLTDDMVTDAWPINRVIVSANNSNPHDWIGFGTWVLVGSGAIYAGISDTFYVWKRTA